MSLSLQVNEIFHSIQGESTWAGSPCIFVRLRGCHLRCTYCDTEYSFKEGDVRTFDEIRQTLGEWPATRVVEITGGEPLLQPNVHDLMRELCDDGYRVLLETSGACDITTCDPRVHRIVDIKTPGSGEAERNRLDDLDHLTERDEVKFVITDRADYLWASEIVRSRAWTCRAVLFSAVFEQPAGLEIIGMQGLPLRDLAEWILEDGLDVRLQTQLHKYIWDPQTRGV